MKLVSLVKRRTIILSSVAVLVLLAPSVMQLSIASSPINFGSIQNLSNDSGASTAPVVATVGNYVYVAWEDASANAKTQTFFGVNSADGATGSWSATHVFSGLSGNANNLLDAVQIAVQGNNVYLTWQQGGATIFACSLNNGGIWNVYTASAGAPTGAMTAQAITGIGSTAYLAWSDAETSTGNQEIFFSSSTNCGTPTIPILLSTGASGGPANGHAEETEMTSIINRGHNYVYVVWDSIFFTVRIDGGAFSTPQQLRPSNCIFPCLAREPMISASWSDVYVTYPANPSGSYQTFIIVSKDNGTSFGSPQVLSTGLSNTREVQVASHGSDVFVTSRGTKTNVKETQQYVYVSTDNGNAFVGPTPVAAAAQSGAETGFGSIVFDQSNGNAYVYWPHGTSSQLFLGSSQNQGVSWGVQQVSNSKNGVITLNDPGGGQGPQLAALNGHVYMVWEDTSTGSGDIYFAAAS